MNSDKKFEILAELAPVGIYLTDPDGNCSYVNKAWLDMAGMRLEDALGKGWVNGIHSDDRIRVFESWENMVASKGVWAEEYRFQTPDGKVTNVWGLANPEYDNDGKIVSYVGVNIDITERKKAEEALNKKNQELEKLNKFMLNREVRMVELKKELDGFKSKTNPK